MATLATNPSNCCIKSVEHTGTPRGSVETIAGLQTYISGPPPSYTGPRKIVLYFSDIYGPFFLNAQLLVDFFAANGYFVLALDYFEGDAVGKHIDTPGFDVYKWVAPKLDKARLITPTWVEAVRAKYDGPRVKWACTGYCFGGPFVMDCLAKNWFSAGAFAHPTALTEDHIKNAIKPILLSCAEEDPAFDSKGRRRAVDILVENGTTFYVQLFSGVKHGFAVQGDVEEPIQKFAKEKSAEGILQWFNLFTA